MAYVLPINKWDSWQIAAEKINNAYLELKDLYEKNKVSVQSGKWFIWNQDTWLLAEQKTVRIFSRGSQILCKVWDEQETVLINLDLVRWDRWERWEKWEKWDPFKYSDFTTEQLNTLKGPKGDKWDQGVQWPTGADAKQTELSVSGWWLSWRRVGETNWNPMIDLMTFKWPQGIQGVQGERWPVWPTWPKGDPLRFEDLNENQKRELRWEQGPRGIDWPIWPRGERWLPGERWPIGPQGMQWERGMQWPIGPAWPAWPKGDKWERGPIGPVWPAGPKGEGVDYSKLTEAEKTNLKWVKGDPGPQGPQGAPWQPWPKGDKGEPWERWLPWATWPIWPVWPVGPQGQKWDPGPKGDKGDWADLTRAKIEQLVGDAQYNNKGLLIPSDYNRAIGRLNVPRGELTDAEQAMISWVWGNRLAFLPFSQVKMEYSVDGNHWLIDGSYTEDIHKDIFSWQNSNALRYNGQKWTKYFRLTLDSFSNNTTNERYFLASMLYLWMQTDNVPCHIWIERATVWQPDNWLSLATKQSTVANRPWAAVINFTPTTFWGNTDQATNNRKYRIIFHLPNRSGNQSFWLGSVRLYWPNLYRWDAPLIRNGMMYEWDGNGNVEFKYAVRWPINQTDSNTWYQDFITKRYAALWSFPSSKSKNTKSEGSFVSFWAWTQEEYWKISNPDSSTLYFTTEL